MIDATGETLRKAMELHRWGKRQEAYDLYQAVLKDYPDHPDALHLLGVLAFQTKNTEQGELLIGKALELRPGYKEAEANLAKLRRGVVEFRHEHEINYQDEAPTTWSPDRAQLVDEWRHNRMLDFATCLKEKPDASWLTIGDAYGHDLIRLARFGITNVMPSNLTTTSLELNKKAGFIPRYLKINAEKIELADGSYDFVLCKEAYHHMPRPILGVYEMLRVAREAVILVEPQDTVIDTLPDRNNPHWYEISGSNVLVGRRGENAPIGKYPLDWYEDVGNYVYTISRRELRKLAIGMQLPLLAFKNFNDHYDPKLSEQPASSPALQETISIIAAKDKEAQARLVPYNYLTAILFKRVPDADILAKLQQLGFALLRVPRLTPPIAWPKL